MCTALILHHAHPAGPLILAANRDEAFERPSTSPTVLRDVWPRAMGGRDLRHGGTWLGLNEAGLFVLVTNMRSQALERRSRGDLALAALGRATVDDIDDLLRAEAAGAAFRPFNLLYGDGRSLHVAHVRDEGIEILDVPRGLHVLPSGGVLDDASLPKVRRARGLLEQAAQAPDLASLRSALVRALGDHRQPSFDELPPALQRSDLGPALEAQVQALCVHTPAYGTRSTAFIAHTAGGPIYEYSAGPACQANLTRVPWPPP